jgi:SHS2 domain-containing protein
MVANTNQEKEFSLVPKLGYSFLPHTTDAYVEAVGRTLEEAMQFAGMALIDTMCVIRSIKPTSTEHIEASGRDEVTLLYDWLESILLKFELEGRVYSAFKVNPIVKSDTGLSVGAAASGERYDRSRHGTKVEVKGVTYHRMEVLKDDSSTIVRFILDL